MSHIPEHHSEEEGEGNNSEEGWIDLFILWDAVSVNNLLERSGEVCGLEEGGSCLCGADLPNLYSMEIETILCQTFETRLEFLSLEDWAPEIPLDQLSGIVHLVEGPVDGHFFESDQSKVLDITDTASSLGIE